MKNNLRRLLPVVAFLFAAVAAMASMSGTHSTENELRKKVGANWVPIPEGEQHQCVGSTGDCTAEFDEQGVIIEETIRPGTYQVLP